MNTVSPILSRCPRPERAGPAMGTIAARGAFWTIFFSVLNKVVTLGSQLALGWLLLPTELGLVALAFSITCVASAFAASTLQRMLVQRSEPQDEDVRQVFWLSLAMNSCGALLLAAASPVAGRLFQQPQVVSLILVMCAVIPIQALPTIYSATLYRQLRFRRVAMIHFGQGLVQSLAAVGLAAAGCGAPSLVWSLMISALFAATAFRLSAGRIEIGRPRPSLWPSLLAPALWLMANALFSALQAYAAGFVIGLAHDARVAGYYYWGFLVSSQAIFLVAANLQGVLFPVFSRLNGELERQYRAVQKACQVMAIAVVPVCVTQILIAAPLIEWVFRDRWLPAVPVVRWLSFGLLTQPLGILAAALFLARGQYRKLAMLTAGLALTVIVAAAIGAAWGAQSEIACAVGCGLFGANAIAGWLAYREFGQGWPGLGSAVFPPLALGLPVALLGVVISRWLRAEALLLQTVLLLSWSVLAYGTLVRLFLPRVFFEVLAHIQPRRSQPATPDLQP